MFKEFCNKIFGIFNARDRKRKQGSPRWAGIFMAKKYSN
jgi:hypothetical protein